MEQLRVVQNEEQAHIGRLKNERDELVERERQLQFQLKSSKDELDAAQGEHDRKFCESEQSARQSLANLREGNEARVAELMREHEEAMEELRDELRRTQEEHVAQLDKRDFDIAEAQKKVRGALTQSRPDTDMYYRLAGFSASVSKRTNRLLRQTPCVAISWLRWASAAFHNKHNCHTALRGHQLLRHGIKSSILKQIRHHQLPFPATMPEHSLQQGGHSLPIFPLVNREAALRRSERG